MNIILFYQHIGRELFSIKKLENILIRRKHNVWVYSIDFELDFAIKLSKKKEINVIVTPWMYHDLNYEQFVPIIKSNPNVKIINLHSEQISSPFSEIVILPAKGVASTSIFHLCWGEYFKKKLQKIGVPENLIYITGSMRNDEVFETSYTRDIIAKKYSLDKHKMWILYPENRNFVKNSNSINIEFMIKGYNEKMLEDRFSFMKDELEKSIDDLNNLPDSFFDKYELIYRAHPGFQGDMGIKNKNIKEISDLSIYEWLNVSDICVVWNSTSAFESDMMHVPVFVCSIDPIPLKYKTEGIENYKHIKTIREIDNIDIRETILEQEEKHNYLYYYGTIDGSATERVADVIECIYENIDDYHAKIIPIRKYYMIKKFLSVYVMRFLVDINLFEKLKYPRSAYQQKKDIPYKKQGGN